MKKRSLFLRLFSIVFLAFTSFGFVACTPKEVLPTQAMPAGASFEGRWYSDFGDVKLSIAQDGKYYGTFDYQDGEIFGELRDGVLLFDWIQPGDFAVGRREVRGKAYFVMGADGKKFTGRWGYNESYTNGGSWNGEKAPNLKK